MLGFDDIGDVEVDLYDKDSSGSRLSWDQFLDFFCNHLASEDEQIDPWW